MNKITGFSVLTTGEGERVTLSYSVLDADGNLFYPKFACNGVTFALACRPFAPDWRWQNA